MNIDFIDFAAPGIWKNAVAITFALKGKTTQVCPELCSRWSWLSASIAWHDVKGKKDELTLMYPCTSMKSFKDFNKDEVGRVLVVGLGEENKLTLSTLRNAVAKAIRLCRDLGMPDIYLDLAALERATTELRKKSGQEQDFPRVVREAVIASLLSLYRFEEFLTSAEEKSKDPETMFLILGNKRDLEAVQNAAHLAEAEAAGICLARDLANAPANKLTPEVFAGRAQNLATGYGMTCRVLDRREIEEEQMGGLLAVARGAKCEPRFVVMEYIPKGKEKEQPVVLVGKGITFDSGGISLKPAAGMQEMKGDMSGAAAVLGVFEALGQLAKQGRKPGHPVIGLMPCTENMPGGNALHPGDIIMPKGGKSVEVLNTDAEGRLILIDALAYAQEHWQPSLLVDIATLTGACAVALGNGAAGLFCTDDELAARMVHEGELLGERQWRLPLWEDTSREALKSNVADLANVGPREGGAIHAAVFLKQFIKDDLVWAHIDMAAADNGESPINAKGATGYGVRTLLERVW